MATGRHDLCVECNDREVIMEVKLRPELERFLDEQLAAGHYASAEDAINAGVARLQTEQELSEVEIQDLRADLDAGLAQADRGEFVEFTAEDIIRERHSARMIKSKDA
jgi:antitoxin ParD1/3/4